MKSQLLRLFFLLSGFSFLVFAIGYVARAPLVVSMWMWPDTRLSFIFVGSICAALATGSLWVAWSRRWRAAIPSLVGLFFVFALSAAYLWGLHLGGTHTGLALHAAGYSAAALVGAVVIAALRGEAPDSAPLMALVRISCAIFSVALLLAGGGLVARYPNVFPWPLSPEASTLFGLTFIGLSAIYALTAARGGWGTGMVAMSGFLVYDLVLLPPYLAHFATVAPERQVSLVLYVAVLVYSAAVAIYFLATDGRAGPRPA